MLRRAFSFAMLLSLLIGTLVLTFDVQPARAGTITVPDDYQTIQAAINNANDGDTVFVKDGMYFENLILSRSLTLIGESRNAIIFQNYTSVTVEVRADNVTVKGLTIRNADDVYSYMHCGVLLSSTSFCDILDNKVEPYPSTGIIVNGGSGNNITNNEIASCSDYGIWVESSTGNTITGNSMDAHFYSLYLSSSDNNYVYDNFFGMHLAWQDYCIFLMRSNSNVIVGNTLYDGSYEGICRIWLLMSCSNSFFQNDFAGLMGANVTIEENSTNNTWDKGYPSGGNYWVDYHGSDMFSGPYQNETGSDGIGETPYVIDANNIDNYPLMNEWYRRVKNLDTHLRYNTIQEAINANETLNGHTIFVEAGTYYESIVVNKTVSLAGEDRLRTIIEGGGGTTIRAKSDGVQIANFTINNGQVLIFGSRNSLKDNDLFGCGIFLWTSNDTIVAGNTVRNADVGIYLLSSCNNTICQNTIENNSEGLELVTALGIPEFPHPLCCFNRFYHNNFLANSRQVVGNGVGNTWDNGYPSGGNYWSDYQGHDYNHDGIGDHSYEIPFEMGYDRYPLMGPYVQPNIAVSNLTTSKTIVGQGFTIDINVTVENQGSKPETFNVTVYANATVISTGTVTLESESSITLRFHWNTSDVTIGSYRLSIVADTVTDEGNASDNNCACGPVKVTILGDVDGDFENGHYDVDLYDAVKLLACYGAKEGEPNFDPNCDIDNCGQVFLYDAVYLLSHYGEKYP